MRSLTDAGSAVSALLPRTIGRTIGRTYRSFAAPSRSSTLAHALVHCGDPGLERRRSHR